MPRPSTELLQATVKCAPSIDNVSAIKACEAAGGECGFRVASRTRRSLVLMPGPRRALFACLAGGGAPAGRVPQSGCGIMAELFVDDEAGNLAVSVATPVAAMGEVFVSRLSSRLESLGASSCTHTWGVEELDGDVSRFKQESQAYYYCSRLFCDVRKAPGSAMAEFVRGFNEKHSALSPTALEHGGPMAECHVTIDRLHSLVLQTVEDLSSEASVGGLNREATVELSLFFRSAVERCVFTRVCSTLWRLYDWRHSAEDAQYLQKARSLENVGSAEMLDALGVSPDFHGNEVTASAASRTNLGSSREQTGLGVEKFDDSGPEASVGTPSTSAETDNASGTQARRGLSSETTATGPFDRAIASLSQLEALFASGRACTPREATEALVLAQLEMRTCALEASGGQAELCAMDDIMPVFVFILARSAVLKPFAYARFMGDALNQDQRLESEGRAVLLLESAARHIAYDWDIADFS